MLDRIGRIRGTTLLTGLLLATMALSPAIAHHKPPHTKKQLKQLAQKIDDRYTKAEADALFLTQAQGDARYYTQAQVDAIAGTYARTKVVKAGGTPIQNGTALRDALAGITAPTAANRHLVKLEPGRFDVGTEELVMKPFVDMEGSGRLGTVITCACGEAANSVIGGTATIHGAVNTELRSLSVVNTGGNDFAHGIDYGGTGPVRVTDVAVEVSGTTDGAVGIVLSEVEPVLHRVDVEVTGSGATGHDLYGIRIADTDAATLEHVNASAKGDVNTTHGVQADNSTVTVMGGQATSSNASQNYAYQGVNEARLSLVSTWADAVGGGDQYFALDLDHSIALVTGSLLVAQGEEGYGIRLGGPDNSFAQVTGSTIVATSSFTSAGFGVGTSGLGEQAMTIDGSRIQTNEEIADAGFEDTIRIGGSFLDGGAPQGSGAVTCAGVWNEVYTFFASTCPT